MRIELYHLLNEERWHHSQTIQALKRERSDAALLAKKLEEVEDLYQKTAEGWRECFDQLVTTSEHSQLLKEELEVKAEELERLHALEVRMHIPFALIYDVD